MNIEDFVLDETEIGKKEKKEVVEKTYSYDVEIESGCDLVIKKTICGKKKLEQYLAILPSQDLKYIKNSKQTKTFDRKDFFNFFKELENPIEISGCNWIKEINRNNLEAIFDFMNSRYFPLIKEGLLSLETRENADIIRLLYDTSKTLAKWAVENNIVSNRKIEYQTFGLAAKIWKEGNKPDIAKFLLLQCIKSSMKEIRIDIEFYDIVENFNLDYKTAINYLLFGLYKQGYSNLEYFTVKMWRDYLQMSGVLNGSLDRFYAPIPGSKVKIKDKYPKSLNDAHNIVKRAYTSASMNINESEFQKIVSEFKWTEFQDKNFLIKVPKTSKEVIDEGDALGHCVASYIPKIINGDCIILFMRKSREPDTSYLTVELIGSNVYEIEGDNKRWDLTVEEKKFIKKWAEEKGLSLEHNNNFYDKYSA